MNKSHRGDETILFFLEQTFGNARAKGLSFT